MTTTTTTKKQETKKKQSKEVVEEKILQNMLQSGKLAEFIDKCVMNDPGHPEVRHIQQIFCLGCMECDKALNDAINEANSNCDDDENNQTKTKKPKAKKATKKQPKSEDGVKPRKKRVLSPTHLAKLQASRIEKKKQRDAEAQKAKENIEVPETVEVQYPIE